MWQSKNYSRKQEVGGLPGCQDSEQNNNPGGMKSSDDEGQTPCQSGRG